MEWSNLALQVFSAAGDSPPIQPLTLTDYWGTILSFALPPVAALLTTIVGWVALRLRSTSKAVESISSRLEECSDLLRQVHGLSVSASAAQARRKF